MIPLQDAFDRKGGKYPRTRVFRLIPEVLTVYAGCPLPAGP